MAKFILREHLENIITDSLNVFIRTQDSQGKLDPATSYPAIIKATKAAQFGDYQVNGILPLAKTLGTNPRELAQAFATYFAQEHSKEFAKVEVAGPGFVNLFLNDVWLAELTPNISHLQANLQAQTAQNIVIDYSAPNIAKEMHVGHLRTTIIGDSLVRVLEFLGHKVTKVNHIGDWGTQFGMLMAYMEEVEKDPEAAGVSIEDLDGFYRAAKARFDADPEFQTYARSLVVKLQGGDPHYYAKWKQLVDITMTQNNRTYRRLGVLLTDDDIMGESMYNPMLPEVVEQALEQGVATLDQGAVVAHLSEFKNKDGEDLGVILRKSDGGYLYATTDLAAMKYRVEHFKADNIIYCTDMRQANHFAQIEIIARKMGYLPESTKVTHAGFGMMLGKDGKPFKSRSGDVVRLNDLLDEAVERTQALLEARNSDVTGEERQELVNALAYGAIKYADLSKNRATDYIFDWDRMISFEGNTAPYMQYSYARIQSILRRHTLPATEAVLITNPYERNLVLKLQEFADVLDKVGSQLTPHLICTYLFELSGIFNSFYENVNIQKTEEKDLQESRINLINYTAKVLEQGLKLLGINVVERM
ncbi:arginine--tRNA ligase [Psittacicella melopsittaci]|uniref:Arginine--tRNA ligase n=1 Tax=Psittacicella melopsittaci TaxID=2028576 RepID=A0A3A1YC58_9GAMM|nr:arginine--tRNA ligase [Psittacicella melopsittaci]RIY33697.1 arginine--tRNA ligase [Psittacicella melopsittaci]